MVVGIVFSGFQAPRAYTRRYDCEDKDETTEIQRGCLMSSALLGDVCGLLFPNDSIQMADKLKPKPDMFYHALYCDGGIRSDNCADSSRIPGNPYSDA